MSTHTTTDHLNAGGFVEEREPSLPTILARLAMRLPTRARRALRAAVAYHGAELVQDALAWEYGRRPDLVRRTLLRAFVREGVAREELAHLLGVSAVRIRRGLDEQKYRESRPRPKWCDGKPINPAAIANALAAAKARNAQARGAA